jgi:hypothetical protein
LDVVPISESGANLFGLVVVGAERHQHIPLVIGYEDDGPHRGFGVLTGPDLVFQLEGPGVLPSLLVDDAVDRDLGCRPRYGVGLLW